MTTTGKLPAFILFLILYAASHWAGQALIAPNNGDSPWIVGPALAFAFILRYGRAWLPLVPIPAILLAVFDGDFFAHPGNSLIAILQETGPVILASLVVLWRHPELLVLDRRKGVFMFLLSALIFSIFSMGAKTLGNAAEPQLETALGHFLAIMTATLFLGPILLACPLKTCPRLQSLKPATIGEILLQAAALFLTTWEVFGRFLSARVHFFYLLFLPFAWIASRFGHVGVAFALGALYLAPVISDIRYDYPPSQIVDLQIRLCVLATTALIFGAIAAERRQAERRMQERAAELAHFQRLSIGWEMASALAHELSQPLTAAMNLSQAALRILNAPSADLARAKEVLGGGIDKIERASQIIHGLRDFMRKGELTLDRTDIRDILDDALRLVGAEIAATGAVIEVTGLAHPPPVMADRTQLGQVLVNLLRNATQAMALAGTYQPKIVVCVAEMDDMIEISITDNGPGIAPNVMDHLFEPFITTKQSGMGLGLSISKSILDAHHGRLVGTNGNQGGATFQVAVPKSVRET